jgi:3'(2'), 5'-bisphosphate nucleotidase
MNNTSYEEYLEGCCQIAKDAGAILMRHFKGDYQTRTKGDKSPVTDADIEANRYICAQLLKLTPAIPIIAEEDESLNRAENQLFWLVDPLDGTRSFVNHEEEFSVNIGLIKNRSPVLGVLYSPPHDILYFAAKGGPAYRQHKNAAPQKITTRKRPGKVVVARSRSKPMPAGLTFLKQFDIDRVIQMSSAIKFGLVAEGQADLYTRFGRTMEWDTAAGHAIIEAAGGRVETATGGKLLYGKTNFENPPFIAYGE